MTGGSKPSSLRDYRAVLDRIAGRYSTRDEAMRVLVDALWEAFGGGTAAEGRGYSWVGFYFKPPLVDEMVLGPRRDKPACSPIGLHGACGRCWRERVSLVVPDVKSLGEHYVACDPRDRAEVVVPVLEADGSCHAVLDVDSFEAGAFSDRDARGIEMLLVKVGLSARDGAPVVVA
ncbi:MAG: GAF domain-containing protein [Phycisphaerales bacterium]|nr:GAF domain-containing protein [Phycisphaerales bacterium]